MSSLKNKRGEKSKVKTVGNLALYLLVALIIFSLFSQACLGQFWGLNLTQGTSMEPIFKDGDVVFVLPYVPSLMEEPNIGEIIVFEATTDEGIKRMFMHRIYEIRGDEIITKGDNVPKTDQEVGWRSLKIGGIQGVVLEIFGYLMVIPRLGGLIKDNWLYLVIGVLELLLILSLIDLKKPKTSKPKKKLEEKRKRKSFYGQHERGITYLAIFLVFTCFLMFLFNSYRQSDYIQYDVSEISSGKMFGSRGLNFGVLQVGTEKSLSRILINFSFKNLRNPICFLAHFFGFFISFRSFFSS
jgi:signal peptidase I